MDKPVEGQKPAEKGQEPDYAGFAFRIMGDFGVAIAIPAVIAAFVGIWLDRHFHTTPWLLMVCIGVALLFTMYFVNNRAHYYADLFDEMGAEEKRQKEKSKPQS